jgi:hypothetical protein
MRCASGGILEKGFSAPLMEQRLKGFDLFELLSRSRQASSRMELV